MSHVGYPTNQGVTYLKREEILVSGVALRDLTFWSLGLRCLLSEEVVGKRNGAAVRPRGQGRQHNAAELGAPFPVVNEDEHVFIYEKPAVGLYFPN